MTSPATQAPSTGATAPEPRQRLQLLISVALRASVAALDGFTRRLGSALTEASLHADESEAGTGLQQAAEHLSRERASFQRLFSDCLQQGLELEAQTLLARPKTRLRSDALDLSLSSFDAMQRKVVIDNLAQAFDRANTELLIALHLRLAHWLGLDAAGLRNPFRAEVFLQAALAAWDRFESHESARAVLLQQLSPSSFFALDAILSAIDQDLRGRRILSDAELRYRRREQGRSAPGMALLHAEQCTLAHAGEVFDRAFDHLAPAGILPARTLALLNRLRPQLREVAAGDSRFVLSPRHPGRRLLQLVVHASLAGGADEESEAGLRKLVDRQAAKLAEDSAQPVLEDLCKQVESHLAPLLQRVAVKRDECIAEATRQERETRTENLAHSEVVARLEDGTVPGFVESFLLEHWTRVLVFAQSVHASRPALLPNLVQAMEDLIWSVQAKPHAHERQELVERQPALLALLNAWLTEVKWEGPERIVFFDQLAQHHTAVLRAAPERSAREQLEERMDVAQRASEHGLRRRAREQDEEALAPSMRRIDALVTGDWVEFVRNDGSTVDCRLAWISAVRSRFVFVAPQAQTAFVISEDMFAQGLRAGRARIMVTGEVFQTVLSIASGELAARVIPPFQDPTSSSTPPDA